MEKLTQVVEEIDAPKIERLIALLPSSSTGPHMGGGRQYFSDESELTATELADRQDGERRKTQREAVYSANA